MFVRNVDINLQSGSDGVLIVEHGIVWLKKLWNEKREGRKIYPKK